jgi:WD40 repeat protein
VDIAEGTTASQFPVPNAEEIWTLAVSPDGKFLAGGYEHQGAFGVLVWDVNMRAMPRRLLPGLEHVYCLCFSPDSKLLVCAQAEGIALYDTSTFQPHPFERGDLPVGVAFSPDSQVLAYQVNNLRLIRLWSISRTRYIAAL